MAILAIMVGCKKTSYVAKFDKSPQERTAEQIALVSNTLTDAPNGWIATLSTQSGGGFSFYLNFDKEQNVNMFADLTTTSSTVVGKSYYRVKQDMGTDLVFDTYNYISMLDDPNSAVYGGQAKIGYSSDIEFIYQKSTTDSILFLGKKFRQNFKLVKATAVQKASYEAGGLKAAIDKFKNFFFTNNNPYIEMLAGGATIKVAVSPNLSTVMNVAKRVDFSAILADGKSIASSNAKFAYTLNGVDILNGGLIYQGITFVRFLWKDATTLAVYDSTGKEYILKNSTDAIVPLYKLWGAKYSGFVSEFKTIYPGTTTTGADILNFYHNNLSVPAVNGIATFNYGRINFVWNVVNSRLIINAHTSQSGGTQTWVTQVVYNYTVDANGVYKFTSYQTASGGYSEKLLARLNTFILNNRITFNNYLDPSGLVYARMASLDDPTTAMSFDFQ